jgi:voltage-gated potassium channel Kch
MASKRVTFSSLLVFMSYFAPNQEQAHSMASSATQRTDKSRSGPSGSAVVEHEGIELESPHPRTKTKKVSNYYLDPEKLNNAAAQEAERKRMEIVTGIQHCWTVFMLLTFLSISAFVLEQELTTSDVYCIHRDSPDVPCDFTIVANTSYDIYGALVFFQIVFSVCTVLSSLAIARAYYLQHVMECHIGNSTPSISSFFGDLTAINPQFLRCVVEALLVLVHIPPGVFQTFSMIDMFDTTITYSVRVINIVVFFRFAFLAYAINSRSPFQRSTGHIATVLYGRPSPLTPLKKIISDDPVTVLFAAFIATLSIFAYFVTIFERPGVNRSSYPGSILEYKHIYNQAWWYVWTTMTTIGYGDWFPLTPLGRVSAVLSSLCGLVLTAILISAIMNVFAPDSAEQTLLRGLNKMNRRKERKEHAAKFLLSFYKFQKGKISRAAYNVFYSKWHQFRKNNEDLNDVFDADDTTGLWRDIAADVKNLVAMQHAHANSSPSAATQDGRSSQIDDELSPLIASLKGLRQPPGTTAVCNVLASSLASYGFTSLTELLVMDKKQAAEILEKLNWSPLQIQKVLHSE